MLTGAAVVALALAVPAAPAAADGLPLPVEDSPDGVLSDDGTSRYLSVTLAGRTAILAQQARTGAVTSRAELRGRYGIPLVAYDSTAGGIAHDGRTLVLIRPRAGFPRKTTTFAIFRTKPYLRLRQTVRLRGDFSYDALSPDGRSLFLINYLSATDPTRYRVRVYDLARNRLDPKPIVDPREPPDEMNGLPVTRVTSADGRWAYTLYDGNGKHPFIHALDTRDRRAVCIDLEGPGFEGANTFETEARARRGRQADRRAAAPVAPWRPSTRPTFRVGKPVSSEPAAVAGNDQAAVASNDPAGPSAWWAALAAALPAGGFVALRVWRRRRGGSAGAAAAADAEFDARVLQNVP